MPRVPTFVLDFSLTSPVFCLSTFPDWKRSSQISRFSRPGGNAVATNNARQCQNKKELQSDTNSLIFWLFRLWISPWFPGHMQNERCHICFCATRSHFAFIESDHSFWEMSRSVFSLSQNPMHGFTRIQDEISGPFCVGLSRFSHILESTVAQKQVAVHFVTIWIPTVTLSHLHLVFNCEITTSLMLGWFVTNSKSATVWKQSWEQPHQQRVHCPLFLHLRFPRPDYGQNSMTFSRIQVIFPGAYSDHGEHSKATILGLRNYCRDFFEVSLGKKVTLVSFEKSAVKMFECQAHAKLKFSPVFHGPKISGFPGTLRFLPVTKNGTFRQMLSLGQSITSTTARSVEGVSSSAADLGLTWCKGWPWKKKVLVMLFCVWIHPVLVRQFLDVRHLRFGSASVIQRVQIQGPWSCFVESKSKMCKSLFIDWFIETIWRVGLPSYWFGNPAPSIEQ